MDPPEVPKMLTKRSSICVLGYLSFERRLYIVSQIPAIRKVEKSSPLHLDTFLIGFNGIRLNEHKYYSSDETVELQKKLAKNPYNINSLGPPAFDTDPTHGKFQKVIDDLIGHRPMIFTKKLELYDLSLWKQRDSKPYRLPVDLKIQAETLDARWCYYNYGDLNRISNILGPKPLKEVLLQLDNYHIFAHPIVRNSEKLVLYCNNVRFDAQRINHRNIHLDGNYRFMDYLNEWIRNQNEVGMEFSGDVGFHRRGHSEFMWKEKPLKEMMYWKKCESGGRRVKADERFPNTLYSISLPRTNNPDTELQYSLLRNPRGYEFDKYPFQIHVKIQPSGTAIPEQSDSVYWELKIWETRKQIRTFCISSCNWVQNLPRRLQNALFQFYPWILFVLVSGILGYFLISWILAGLCGRKCLPFL
ncbi:unnamed protein product [Caenorhabditis nigoni]